jgi:hypothetical protein
MLLSVSRRTDIPNYYSEWFFNRIKEGFLQVRNPMNEHQVSKIDLSPEVIDCIIFWTKNPAPMLERLDELKDYKYYFQFTLTGYEKDMEPALPNKREELIPTFKRLSEKIGSDKVIWRYDPILLNEKYSREYHIKTFGEIADSLNGYTERVVISFVDLYAKTMRNTDGMNVKRMTEAEMIGMTKGMVKIANRNHMEIETCAEQIELSHIGVRHGSCIDRELIEKIIGCKIAGAKDKNQRAGCGCLESVEMGTYHTCKNGCKYCYANFSDEKVERNVRQYDVNSPLLCTSIGPKDKITDRNMKSLKEEQLNLFDVFKS